ncbi:MAG: hypothetical protein K8R54_16940 [Bacteroidales bacterium]|nr:hypothetical protein [Bacteroidales bacterium]
MFNAPKLTRFRNDEHIQFNKDIQYVCEQANPDTLNIKTQFDIMKAGTVKMETAYLQLRGSELTKKLEDKDYIRDNFIIGIEKIADAFTHHFNEEYTEAGERVLTHIKKYGRSIARMNYQAETTALTDLIDFAKNDTKLQAAVTLLGLNEWFTKLEESNIEFNRLYMVRVDEEAGKPKLNLKELRTESIAQYRELIKHLSSHAVVSPSELYESTINKFNELIDKYNALRR